MLLRVVADALLGIDEHGLKCGKTVRRGVGENPRTGRGSSVCAGRLTPSPKGLYQLVGNRPTVTLLVVTGTPSSVVGAPLGEVDERHVATVSAAVAAIEDDPPSAVVVDRESTVRDGGDGGDDLGVRAVLDAAGSAPTVVPVVLVADDDAVQTVRPVDDLLVRPVEPDRLRNAVDRALLVHEYDRTVTELFDAARAAASDDSGPPWRVEELGRLRRKADALIDDLVALDAPDLLATLVETTTGSDAPPVDGENA